MRPVHVAPDGGLRIVLVKHVIAPAEKNRAVGIVHPVVRGKQVVLGAKGIGGQLATQGSSARIGGERRESSQRRSDRGGTGQL